MRHFHAVRWVDGNFDATVTVLSFDSKAARAAYSAQSKNRISPITHAWKIKYATQGRKQIFLQWDAHKPTKFVAAP